MSADLDLVAAAFAADVIREALSAGRAVTYRRRAEMLRWAQHRPGIDWPGGASLDELRARWSLLEEAAMACERTARLAERAGLDDVA
jgi:hypothetical protein